MVVGDAKKTFPLQKLIWQRSREGLAVYEALKTIADEGKFTVIGVRVQGTQYGSLEQPAGSDI